MIPSWIVTAVVCVVVLALVCIALLEIPGYIDRRVEESMSGEVERVRKAYTVDTNAAKEVVSLGFNRFQTRLEELETAVKRLAETQAEIKGTIDTYMRNSVSPIALKKVADEATAAKSVAEKTQSSLTESATALAATQQDVTRMNEYLAKQLYPALVGLQQSMKDLRAQNEKAQHDLESVPVGVLLPSPAKEGQPPGGR